MDAGIKVQRRSIKRMSLARLRKTSEFSGLRPMGQQQQNGDLEDADQFDDVEEHRKIKGLKHSKVPMMVYSHGGFSRCFRIARRYQVDGPPIGVEYFEEQPEAEKSNLSPEAVGQNAWEKRLFQSVDDGQVLNALDAMDMSEHNTQTNLVSFLCIWRMSFFEWVWRWVEERCCKGYVLLFVTKQRK